LGSHFPPKSSICLPYRIGESGGIWFGDPARVIRLNVFEYVSYISLFRGPRVAPPGAFRPSNVVHVSGSPYFFRQLDEDAKQARTRKPYSHTFWDPAITLILAGEPARGCSRRSLLLGPVSPNSTPVWLEEPKQSNFHLARKYYPGYFAPLRLLREFPPFSHLYLSSWTRFCTQTSLFPSTCPCPCLGDLAESRAPGCQ